MITFAVENWENSKKYIIMSNKNTNEAPIAADEVLSKSEALIIQYKKPIVAIIAAIVIIILGYSCYNTYVAEPKEQEAAEAIFTAENLFAAQDFEKALNGDGVNLGFIQIAEDYSGTAAGNIANAYAGMALAQLERYEEAIDYLKAFDGDDKMVAPAVYGTLGSCYAQTGDADAAISNYKKAAKMANNTTISPTYLLQAGIMCELQGDKEEAAELYQEIKSKYAASPLSMEIDKYINRVK